MSNVEQSAGWVEGDRQDCHIHAINGGLDLATTIEAIGSMKHCDYPRVLHVAETIIGGVSSYLQEIINYQTETLGDDNVRLLVPEDQAHDLRSINAKLLFNFRRTGRNVRSLITFSLALSRALRQFKPTVVHLHSSFAGAVARPILLFSRPRPRVIYCAHGWAFLMEIPAWKQQIYTLVERTLGRITDVIINISRYEDREAKARGIAPEKCVVVRNAISAAPSSGLAESPFDDSKINLLFVGRFDRQKGLDLLLRAMERLTDRPVHLHVIGGCFHDEHAPQSTDNVTLLGWMSRERLDHFYAAADALVMPSRWEGFGLVAIEAMRNGTAVIASNRGALPELVEEGRSGHLFELSETDTADLERVLRNLDKQKLRQMGQAALQHFQASFTADVMNRSLLDIYSTLHEHRPALNSRLQLSRGNL